MGFAAALLLLTCAGSLLGHADFSLPQSTAGLVLGEIVELHGRIARQATVNLLTRHPRHLWNSEDSPPRQVREDDVGADWDPTPEEIAILNVFFGV